MLKHNYETTIVTDVADLQRFRDGSALTFEGVETSEANLEFLTNWLSAHGGWNKPQLPMYIVTGKLMNDTYGLTGDNRYSDDLTILVIELEELSDVNKIVIPRFEIQGRWFDDVVDNNLRREGTFDDE